MDRYWLKNYPKGVPADIDYHQYKSLVQLLEEAFKKYSGQTAYSCMGKAADVRRPRHPVGSDRRLAAEPGVHQGQARGHHDAERAAVPGGAGRCAACRLHGRQCQSAVHATGARAPAQGLRRRSDLHSRELRDDAAAGGRQGPDQDGRRLRNGRHARLRQGPAGQFRRAQRQEDGARVHACQRVALERGACRRTAHVAEAGRRDAERHGVPAVHRRNDRREQGRTAAAQEHRCQRAAIRDLVPARAEEAQAGRAADRHHRAAAVPHLRADGVRDAVGTRWRSLRADPESARHPGLRQGTCRSTHSTSSRRSTRCSMAC